MIGQEFLLPKNYPQTMKNTYLVIGKIWRWMTEVPKCQECDNITLFWVHYFLKTEFVYKCIQFILFDEFIKIEYAFGLTYVILVTRRILLRRIVLTGTHKRKIFIRNCKIRTFEIYFIIIRLGAYRFGVSVCPSVRHRLFSRLYLCNEWS